MEFRKDDFPIALQAYELHENTLDFVAEQVVKSEEEAENFLSRYPDKLIRARDIKSFDAARFDDIEINKTVFPLWAIVLAILLVLILAAILSGWLQRKLGL